MAKKKNISIDAQLIETAGIVKDKTGINIQRQFEDAWKEKYVEHLPKTKKSK